MAHLMNVQVMSKPGKDEFVQPYGPNDVTPTFRFHAKLEEAALTHRATVSPPFQPNVHQPGTAGPFPVYMASLDNAAKLALARQLQGWTIPTAVPVPPTVPAGFMMPPIATGGNYKMDLAEPHARGATAFTMPDDDDYHQVIDNKDAGNKDDVFHSCDMKIEQAHVSHLTSPGLTPPPVVEDHTSFKTAATFNTAASYMLSTVLGPNVLIEPIVSKWEYKAALVKAQGKYGPDACVLIGNLPASLSDDVLSCIVQHEFREYGECWCCVFRAGDVIGSRRPYAIVQYSTHMDAAAAFYCGQEKDIAGFSVRVEWSKRVV